MGLLLCMLGCGMLYILAKLLAECTIFFEFISKLYIHKLFFHLPLSLTPSPGFFFEPTIFTAVEDHMFIAKEESFGPIMIISKFESGSV